MGLADWVGRAVHGKVALMSGVGRTSTIMRRARGGCRSTTPRTLKRSRREYEVMSTKSEISSMLTLGRAEVIARNTAGGAILVKRILD